MASQGITTNQVKTAAAELAKMQSSLRAWLRYRELNDRVLAGSAPTKVPPGHAKRLIAQTRDLAVEQDLATKLHALLTELMPKIVLPNPDLSQNPTAAVQLGKLALSGGSGPQPLAGLGMTHPWLWPVVIVGGLLLAVTTAVKSAADVAKEREHYACIQAGACTDYGFWLKAGGVTILAWFAWTQLGVGDIVKSAIKKRRP